MSLRIAFDLDGVLADMEGELARQAEIVFGNGVAPQRALKGDPTQGGDDAAEGPAVDDVQIPDRLQLTMRQQRRLWRHVATLENFWEQLTEIEPGVIARLWSFAIERRWEVIFLTKRPESAGATSQIQTQRWLAAKGFTHPSVYVVRGSRGLIAASLELDVVVDDRPENCMDVLVDSKAHPMLVWRTDPKQLPPSAKRLGMEVVKTVDECLNLLLTVDAPAAGKPRAIERVKRLLGLKHSAKS